MQRPIRTAAFALAFAPALLLAQQPRALPAPDATFAEPFSQVSGLRELSTGRVLVADARDKVLQLVDLAAGSATKIGREGSGPGEFALPFRLFGIAGDTTFLFDPGNSRYLVIGPDAKPGTSFRIESGGATGPGGGIRIGFAPSRVADGRGRLYYEPPSFGQGPDGRPQPADSAPILRYDRVTQKNDTIAMVKVAPPNVRVSGSAGNQNVQMSPPNPLLPRDEWTVFPDGRVAIARTNPFRVDFVMPNGTKSSTAAFRYTPLRMTEADKKEEEALRVRNNASGLRMTVTADGRGAPQTSASVGGPAGPPPPPLTDWPETKPPFRSGAASVWARSNGELWIRRTEPAGAVGTLYDVVNAQGAAAYQVRLDKGITLVGFGNGTVYTTKADEDDLLYLQRHRMP